MNSELKPMDAASLTLMVDGDNHHVVVCGKPGDRSYELLIELASLYEELAEQARLNGIGSEREARLMARVAELEKDAERYRFLRNHKLLDDHWSMNWSELSHADAIDAEIDDLRGISGTQPSRREIK